MTTKQTKNDEAALDKTLKAIIGSGASTDAEVLAALSKALVLNETHLGRSERDLIESKKALANADQALVLR